MTLHKYNVLNKLLLSKTLFYQIGAEEKTLGFLESRLVNMRRSVDLDRQRSPKSSSRCPTFDCLNVIKVSQK